MINKHQGHTAVEYIVNRGHRLYVIFLRKKHAARTQNFSLTDSS